MLENLVATSLLLDLNHVIWSHFLLCLPVVYSSFSSAFKAPDPVPGPALEKKYPVEMSSLQLLN